MFFPVNNLCIQNDFNNHIMLVRLFIVTGIWALCVEIQTNIVLYMHHLGSKESNKGSLLCSVPTTP